MAARDWFLIVLLGAIWGCSFLFNAVLIRELGPITVSAGRVTIAAIASWIFLLAMRKQMPGGAGLWAQIMLLGVFSYAVPFTLFPIAQAHVASGIAAIVNAMTPLMTVVISHFWPGGEKGTPTKFLGVAAGFGGVAMLSVPALSAGGTSQLWAIGLCLLATLIYAISLNYTRKFKAIEPTSVATISLTGASLVAVPIALIAEGIPVVTRIETWGAWLGIGLLATFFAFQIMFRILPRVGPTNFSATTFIAPVFAILLGLGLLGEEIHLEHFAGMGLIFFGLLLIDGRLFRRRQPAGA